MIQIKFLKCCSTGRKGVWVVGLMTQFPMQWHYPDIELTSPWPVLVMSSIRLGNDKYQFCVSLVLLGKVSNFQPSALEACALTNLVTAPSEKHSR